jgi:DMSO reductase anchor subunit
LGGLLTISLLPPDAPSGIKGSIAVACILSFLAAGFVTLSMANTKNMQLSKWRIGLLVPGFLGALVLFSSPAKMGNGIVSLLLVIALAEEGIGRWLFYTRRDPGI